MGELRAGAHLLQMTVEVAERWFLELDADGSGAVSRDEFLERWAASAEK